MESGIRPPAVCGTFYPAEKNELAAVVSLFFANTRRIVKNKHIKALIVPHAGFIYSGQTASWGYRQLPQRRIGQHFILLGPSHYEYFSGVAADASEFWETPLGQIKRRSVNGKSFVSMTINPSAHALEHSLEVQFPFLQYLYKNEFSFTALLTGGNVNTHDVAACLLRHAKHSIFIISSDLSHYLSEKEAREKDKKTIEAILQLDPDYFDREENVACGQEAIKILIEMARVQKWQRQLVYYDTSATASGDKNRVVGYAAIAFYV